MKIKLSFSLAIILLSITSLIHAATITSTTTGGDWAAGASWIGGVAPTNTDAAVIATTGAGAITTAAGTITCAGLTINSGATLTMKRPFIVNGATSVTGTLNFGSTNATSNLMTFNGDVSLNSGAIWTETATSAIPTFTFANNFINNSTTFTALTGVHTFSGTGMSFSGNSTSSIANISITGTYTNNGILTATTTLIGAGTLTNGATGTLNIGGTSTITTLVATAGGNTVKYTGANQTGIVTTYNHLTIAGSGTKTFATTPTVNGTLSMEGTAIITVTTGVVTYGASATLSYNTATARTASLEEWITPFTASGGVIIANTGTITMNAAKTFDPSVPLTINSGATLSLSSFLLTLSGSLINNGGTVSGTTGGVIITGSVSQSIGAFTTTGTVSMTKTAGTATLTGNVNGAALTINGTGGTIDLGVGLTHTFTGTWTRTAGTLLGGSSNLILSSTISGSGGTFTANTGTVTFNAAGAQTIPILTYYNLSLTNSGTKTLFGATTISGGVSISGTATINLGSFASTGATLSLGGNGRNSGTWGGTGSAAGNINTSYFGNATGVLTIASTLVTPGYWTGATNTDWNTASNWQGGSVPTASTNVAIFSGGNQPTINSSAVCNNINLNTGATLTISDSNTLTVSGNWYHNGSFIANTSTVIYNGTAQTAAAATYNNLTLSTSGLKTFATAPTINGILSMEGTSTISIAPTYGASATLQYNTNTLRTAGVEWISSFAGTGGIVIANTGTITMNAAKTLGASVPLTINASSILSTGTSTTSTLTVGGITTINGKLLLANTAAKVFTGNVTINSGGEWSETAASTYSFGGNLVNNATLFTASTGIHTFTGTGVNISGTTTTSIPSIAITGTCTNNNTLTIGSALSGVGSITNAATGILSIGGTCSIATLTATAAGNTVKYTGAAQTGIVTIYSNLSLAGSGLKTFITSPTVNLLLSMEGTATISTAPFYDTAAGLIYNTATARTAGVEWISPFIATGGVTISSTGLITLDAVKVFGSTVPLTINSGASLNTKSGSNFALTFGGDFIKNGTLTANASAITISGTMTNQSIAGFTTTGTVSMTKTAGTATFTGAVSGAAFTMNGIGGTLNLGTGLTHTFTGVWTRNNGILNGGSSTLNLSNSVSGTGGTFTASTGTVNYYGTVQTLGLLTYNNLTLSGSGSKTFPAGTITVNGILSREGTATTTITGTLTYGASSTLQYKGSAAQTTGNEFVSPFPGSGGVKIENTLGVSLGAARSLGSNPLTIGSVVSNSIFKDAGFQLTATGTLNLTSGTFKLGAGTATTFPAFSTNNIATGTTVEYAATATQVIKGLIYGNLTISGTGNRSKIADANTTVNGVLTLTSANFTATQGCLDMGAYTLTMGSTATTVGTGDVTGIITRTSFVANNPYSFGNQFTTISLTADGTLPSSMSVKATLSTTHAFKANAIHRYYDIIQTGGNAATKVTLNLHYLSTELNAAVEGNLDLFGNLNTGPVLTDEGHSNINTTNKWVGLTNLSLTNVAVSNNFGAKYWTLGTSASNNTWTGASSTVWTNAANWSGAVVPTSGIHAIIPDAATTPNDPTLPANATLGYISIQSGGILNGGTGTVLTMDGSSSAWDNSGTFSAGTSTVTFTNAAATLSGTTDFNNVTIGNGATLTLGTGTLFRIAGTFTLTGTGILNATTNANTIEYNGASQTIISPNGTSPGFSSLILSGSGTKTLPATALTLLGDFTTSGTISVNAGGALSISGNVVLGSGTSFNASTFTHNIGGNWTNNGATFTPSTSLINFNNTVDVQEINGTAASQTFNRINIAKTAQTLSVGGNTSTLTLNGSLTISSGVIDIGTALNLNVAGNWSNSGTFTAGSGMVSFNGISPQYISGANTFNNLTINNTTGITATANQTVNGNLNLQSANASASQGCLEMGAYTLFMGPTATTIGDGDVTGIVNRSYFDINTPYSFGSQYTNMTISASGTLPTSISFKVTLTNPVWKTDAVNRFYEITQSGFDANTRISVNLHYLDSELNGASEGNLDLFDDHVTEVLVHDHGHSNYNTTNNWVGLTNLGLQFVSTGANHFWTIGTNNSSDNRTWIGGNTAGVTDWNLPENWNGGLPTGTSHVIIPNVTYDPILPDNTTIGSLSIQAGGLLTDDTGYTLSIAGGNGAWDNLGTFAPGLGTVEFTNTDATMSGTTNFNNLSITDGAALTLQEDNIIRITGNLSIAGAGILNANDHKNTVEYNGNDQTIAFPTSATGSYYNLALSGSGIKTMPSLPLGIGMDLTLSGTVSVTASQDINVTRNITISTGTSLNGGSYTLSTAGNWVNNGTFSANAGTVEFKGTSAQTISGTNTFYNLTISKSGGITANADITVNSILNLAAANPSATKGLLEMTHNYGTYPGTTGTDYLDSYILNMGASATTIGIGDVTGTIKRTNISANLPYTFGNQYTILSLTTGVMPTALTVTTTIGTTAPGPISGTDKVRDAIKRTYEIIATGGSGSNVTANFHYLDSELTSSISPNFTNTDINLTTMDYDLGNGASVSSEEHGRANFDYTNKYIGFSSMPISYFIQVPTTHEYRSIITLRDFSTNHYTWNGTVSTDWTNSLNWTPAGVPGTGTNVVIPDAGTTTYDPALPAGTTTVNTMTIENGGILTMGSNTINTESTMGAGWQDQNPLGNDPGTGKVTFLNPGAAISGTARFYDLEIANGADVTNQLNSYVQIAHSLTKTGTGKWYASVFNNTVDYNGGAQTIAVPDDGYKNLVLSGGAVNKSLPSSAFLISGSLTLTGSVTAIADGAMTLVGNLNIGTGTTFNAGTTGHFISGNIESNGILSPSTGTITMSGTSSQSIFGTESSTSFHNLTINNAVGVSIDKNVTADNLSINSGKKLSISPTKGLTVTTGIDNQAGVDGLTIKASSTAANGTLIFAGTPPLGTVEMYSVASWNLAAAAGSKYKWQFFGIPTSGVAASPFFDGTYVRRYNEPTGSWIQMKNGDSIDPFTGYEITQSGNKTYSHTGTLVNADNTIALSYTGAASYPGQHILGNPYAAAIDINLLTFGSDTDETIYLYNTGSLQDWADNNGAAGNGTSPGQYTAASKIAAGTLGIPGEIPSMQGFLVKATAPAGGSITINYNTVKKLNAELQRAPAAEKVAMRIDLKGKRFSDRMWIFSDPSCTRGFDSGWDGEKFLGSSMTPQLYATEASGDYQIDAVDDMNNTELSFQAGVDPNYTLTFTHQNMAFAYPNLYLVDLLENNLTTDISQSGATYSFTAVQTGSPSKRFKIITLKDIATSQNEVVGSGIDQFTVFSSGKTLFIQNKSDEVGSFYLYDMTGRMLQQIPFGSKDVKSTMLSLPSGSYILKGQTKGQTISKKIML